MSKLKNRLLKNLKKNHVHPIPKSVFILKNLAIWGLVGLFALLGIFSIMFLFYFGTHLEILSFILDAPRMLPKILFVGVPFFWLIFALGFTFFAGFSMGKTKKGYKLSRYWFFLGGFLIQVFIGILLSQSTIAENFEKTIQRRVRFFEGLDQKKGRLWKNPEHGFLAGEIKEISSTSEWIIVDFQKEKWTIQFTEKTILPNEIEFKVGQKIRIQGELLDKESKVFEAQKIFPFRGDRKHFRKNMKNIIDRLPPEERERFRENIHRLEKDRSPENREILHKTMKEAIEKLSPEERQKIQEERNNFKKRRPPEGERRFHEEMENIPSSILPEES